MSDYHIREIVVDKKTVDAVFGADEITSILPDIPSADLTAMKAGDI